MSKKTHNKKISLTSSISQGTKISAPELIEIESFNHPIFCFKHLHKDHNLDKCIDDEKRALIEQIVKLSQLTWNDIQLSRRHGLGSEKIRRKSIKPSIPVFITEDVDFFLALRYDGKKAMIGYRNRFIFHLIYIDRNHTVY